MLTKEENLQYAEINRRVPFIHTQWHPIPCNFMGIYSRYLLGGHRILESLRSEQRHSLWIGFLRNTLKLTNPK